MPFAFFNPWFWLGALAVAAPIWLHLRRKTQRDIVQFSALRFLEDQPEPRRSPMRLRNLVLFALRSLALLLIVAAFSWPYLRKADTVPIKESRANGDTAFGQTQARLFDGYLQHCFAIQFL